MRNGLTAVIILVAMAAVYGLLASSSTLWDRDEPRFARATMEMVESGNYLYPTFNGQLRPDKPILIYWLMSAFVQVLGSRELAFRLPSILGMAASCYMTYLVARRLFCARTGLWAMAIMATSLMAIVEGAAATADGVLLACMMAAIWPYLSTGGRGITGSGALVTGLTLGLAMLAKGPVGLLPAGVIAVATVLQGRQWREERRVLWPLAAAVALGVCMFLAWALPANAATGGRFAQMGLGHHVLGRSVRPLEGHGGRWLLYLPYYLPVAVLFFCPWSIHLPGAMSAALGGRIADRRARDLLLVWIGTVVVIMTFVATKLPHYVLFAWPAMAIIVARTIVLAGAGQLNQTDLRWLKAGVLLYAPLALAAVLALGAAGWVVGGNRYSPLAAAVVAAVTGVTAVWEQTQGRIQRSSMVLAVGTAVLLVVVSVVVMPVLEEVKISPRLAQAVRRQAGPDVPVARYGYAEPTLNLYLDRRIEDLNGLDQVCAWLERPGEGVLILSGDVLGKLGSAYHRGLRKIASVSGYNYNKGRWMTVVAVAKD